MSFNAALKAARRFAVSSLPRDCGSSAFLPDSIRIDDDSLDDLELGCPSCIDQGISMVEIVISMFLLAVLSLALVPLLITVTQHTVVNQDTLAATSFAQSELTRVQASFPSSPASTDTSCAALSGRVNTTGIPDPTNTYGAFLTVGLCPVEFPGIVPVKITVKKDSQTVSTLSSHVRVAKAG